MIIQIMKKLFTIDAIMASLIGSIGYGAGYVIPQSFGVNVFISILICYAAGMTCDKVADKVIFNSSTQKSFGRRCLVFVGIALVFAAAYFVVQKYFAHSLWSDVGYYLPFVVGVPVIAFCVSFGIRIIKRYRLLKKYGSGEGGFVVDEKALEALAAFKGENQKLANLPEKNPVAKTAFGTFVGKKEKAGVRFLGIPYAKAGRWERAKPLEKSEEIFEAYYFGNSEIQPDSSHNVLTKFNQGEDCLNLNVWTAKYEPEKKKPVLVYFHGGDGRYGGSANPIYHLENIAKAIPDAVFVSVNYRFGVFGVVDFSASGLPDANEYQDTTALSLLDQIEALKWIKANISAFGGDSENITVAGDSAGGSDICLLAATKEAKGLFKRALIMCASTYDTPSDDEKASQLGKKLVEEFNAKSVAELKRVSAEQLRSFSNKHYDLIELPPRGGRLIPQNVTKEYLDGVASDIDFIFGIAADDISGWQAMLAGEVSLDAMAEAYFENLKNYMGTEKSDKIDELLKTYMKGGLNEAEAKKVMLADFQYKACPLYDCVALAKGGSSVRCFLWDVKGDIEKFTANSASMVTAMLGNREIAEQMGYLQDKNITEIMQAMTNKFVHGQKPSLFNNEIKGVNEISWSEYTPENRNVLHISSDGICMSESAFSENVRELENLFDDGYNLIGG